MGEPIKIIVMAETAQAAAALQQFVQSAGSGLQQLASRGAASASALRQVRETALLTHEGLRGFEGTLFLIGGTRFPELTVGAMTAVQGLRALRTTAMLTGASMSTMLPVLGGIAAVVGAGALIWGTFRAAEERTIAENNKLTESFKEMPEVIRRINDAAKGGVLSADEQNRLLQNIGAVKAALSSEDFKKSLTSGLMAPQPSVNAQFTGRISTSQMGIPDATDIRHTNEELAKMGILLKTIDPKDPKKVTYSINPQIEAMDKIAELQKKLTLEVLIGFDKERAAAKQKYDDELQSLNEYIEMAGNKLDPKKAGELRDDLASGYQTQLDAIAKKQSDEAVRQQAESTAKIKEQFAKDTAAQEKELEQQITLSQAGESAERNKNFEHEYQQRVFLAQQFLYSGEIDEKQYTDLVTEASIKRLGAQKKYNDELKQEATLKQEIARATLEGRITAIQGNPLLTDLQKADQSVPLYREMMQQNEARIQALQLIAQQSTDESAQLQAQKQMTDIMREQAQL
jgi:hypothetical protein